MVQVPCFLLVFLVPFCSCQQILLNSVNQNPPFARISEYGVGSLALTGGVQAIHPDTDIYPVRGTEKKEIVTGGRFSIPLVLPEKNAKLKRPFEHSAIIRMRQSPGIFGPRPFVAIVSLPYPTSYARTKYGRLQPSQPVRAIQNVEFFAGETENTRSSVNKHVQEVRKMEIAQLHYPRWNEENKPTPDVENVEPETLSQLLANQRRRNVRSNKTPTDENNDLVRVSSGLYRQGSVVRAPLDPQEGPLKQFMGKENRPIEGLISMFPQGNVVSFRRGENGVRKGVRINKLEEGK